MKKIVSLVISLGILALIYWRLSQHGQLDDLQRIFSASDRLWMALSLGMVVPLTLFTSWRLQQLMPRRDQLSFGEANRLILVASVLNLVLPSKMGDIAKAYFMKDKSGLSGSLALSLVVFEKACDMLSLLLWCVFGMLWVLFTGGEPMRAFSPAAWSAQFKLNVQPPEWLGSGVVFSLCFAVVLGSLALGVSLLASRRFAQLFFDLGQKFAPGKVKGKLGKLGASWHEMHGYFWASQSKFLTVAGTSVFIWLLHLLQIWMFTLALKSFVPFLANLALSPLAILAGLLPLTFAGIGVRDAALVLFYSPYFPASTAAALGILCTARYVLPAIGGLPFAGRYFQSVKTMRKSELATTPA